MTKPKLVKNKNPNYSSNSLEYWNWACVKNMSIKQYVARQQEEWEQWIVDYTTGKWFVNSNRYYYFENEDDAILFKLTCG